MTERPRPGDPLMPHDPRYSQPADVMALAKAMRADPEIWEIFDRIGDRHRLNKKDKIKLNNFELNYIENVESGYGIIEPPCGGNYQFTR